MKMKMVLKGRYSKADVHMVLSFECGSKDVIADRLMCEDGFEYVEGIRRHQSKAEAAKAARAAQAKQEADAAANEVSSMLTWTSFDCFEAVAYGFFVGLGAYPLYGLISAVLFGLCAPLACSILA